MSIVNRIVHLPISKLKTDGTGDLQVALNCPHLVEQEDVFAYGDVNKWAKFKGVKNDQDSYADQLDANKDWLPTASWWKAYNGQCGLTFTTYPGLGTPSSGFLQALLAGSLGWGYERPSGNYPLRTYDFNQYYLDAPKPITGVYSNLQLFGGGQLRVQLDETRALNGLGLQLSDLTITNSPVSGWYVGILIYKSSSQWSFAFSSGTLGGGGSLDVEFTNMTSFAGAATIVPFISSVRAGQGIDPGAGVFVSVDVAPQSVNIEPEVTAVVTTIDAQWRDTFYVRVGYAVNIINNTYSAFTVNNVLIALYDGYQNINTRSVGTATIPARTNQEYTGVFIVAAHDPSKTYQLVVTSDSQYVTGTKVVDDPRT